MRVAVFACLAGLATPAFADQKAKAAAHFKQGKAFFEAKQYDQAIAEYRAAYSIDKVPSHLFNIARALHLKGDLKSAIEAYQGYLDVEPNSARAAEVRGYVVALTQQLADEAAKLDEEAKRKLAEEARTKAAAHVKQAEAYARAGTWTKAGDEHRAAAVADGDPAHLIAAAEAYGKQPDHPKQRDAYLAYLDKVPNGANSDAIRTKVAEVTSAIEKAERAERDRVASNKPDLVTPGGQVVKVETPPPRWPKTKQLGFGAEVRLGPHATAGFVSNDSSNLRASDKGGINLLAGGFGDVWITPKHRFQFGLRANVIKASFAAEECSDPDMCPKDINLLLAGPVLAIETAIYRGRETNIHFVLGGFAGFGLQNAVTATNNTDSDIPGFNSLQLSFEFGWGVRVGRLSVAAVAQLTLTGVSSELDVGNSRTIGLGFGWSSSSRP